MNNRYYKFFKEDGKSLILAFDHGLMGDLRVDPSKVIKAVAEGGMDGILTSYGVISNFKKEIGQMGTFLRLEVFGSKVADVDPFIGSAMETPYTIEDALRLGADGVMMLGIVGNEFDKRNLNYIAGVVAACNKYGLVSGAEMLPNGFSTKPEDRTIEKVTTACRAAAEIGVDIVKTVYVKPVEEYKKVVANCYVPILILGGSKIPDDRLVLEHARESMDAGCKGLIIGRNVFNHKNISGMASALRRIVHEDASVDDAMKEI